jgi:hypothetical protein
MAETTDEVLGLPIDELPEGWTALEAIVLTKCLDDTGEVCWTSRTTPGLNDMEVLGLLHNEVREVTDELRGSTRSDE